MVKFIKNQIVKQYNISKELGKEKYISYFINTTIYENYRNEVNELLRKEGYDYCIVD